MIQALRKMLECSFDEVIQDYQNMELGDEEQDLAESFYRRGVIDGAKMFLLLQGKEGTDLVIEPLARMTATGLKTSTNHDR